MFWDNKRFQDWYYNFLYRIGLFEGSVKLIDIDFQKPWWHSLSSVKTILILSSFSGMFQDAISNLSPVILSYIIFNGDVTALTILVSVLILSQLFIRFFSRVRTIALANLQTSMSNSAYKYFLTIDPIFHSTKSSGKIISEISRGSSALTSYVESVSDSILPSIIGFITVIITLFSFDSTLGIISAITFLIMTTINSIFAFINARSLVKKTSLAEDRKSAVTTESLQQVVHIRSSFATTEQINRLADKSIQVVYTNAVSRFGFSLIAGLNRIIFLIASFIIGLIVIEMVKNSELTSATALSLMLVFLSLSGRTMGIGLTIRNLTQRYAHITDLYEFIRGFGKQSYPVLDNDR